MRRALLLGLFIAGITFAIFAQDTWSDAKRYLGEEWLDHPKQCMKALGGGLSGDANAVTDLGLGLGDKVNAVYNDASSYPDFWQLVVTVPPLPPKASPGAPAAPPTPPKTERELRKAVDDACATANTVSDLLYDNAQIPLLRRSLVRYQTNPVGAVYLLLAAIPNDNDDEWQKNLTAMRACFASDPPKLGTRLFDYVSTKLTRK